MTLKKFPEMIAAIVMLVMAGMSHSAVISNQGFETDTGDWSAYNGTINRVASGSGTLGLTSADGSFHAELGNVDSGGPYTWFDDYANRGGAFPSGGYTASIDIYLDTSWATGSGFDYSVAAYQSTVQDHLRDFIFHVTQDTSTGSLLVAGSNNTNFDPIENLESGNHYVVGASGWYTFQHVFYDNAGSLAVDMNLLDDLGNILFTETRNNPADLIPGIAGGHGYGWFTNIDIGDGIAIDNVSLTTVPEPSTYLLMSLGLLGIGFSGKRRIR
ncbi:MAG: PEP-CTERM sorting domain-containing protein [Chromatiales bacterium]|jgi:hypothetical protein